MARRNSGPNPRDVQALLGAFLRLNPVVQLIIIGLLVAVAAVIYYANRPAATTGPNYSGSPHLLLGNPSGAMADTANQQNFLMDKSTFVLSYNNYKGTPNWVSWRVTRDDLGHAPRKPNFDADVALPNGYYRVSHKDYSSSGFDRGHMCPHADRAASKESAWTTFVMTNIIPQAPNVNEKAWANMENYCRDLVRQDHRLYIVTGPAGQGGRGANGARETIAKGKVTVPAECWKVVVVVPVAGGENDLVKINASTRVIAVNMPNDNEQVSEDWGVYRTTAAQIEARTGYQFFTNLSPDVAQALRQKQDNVSIPVPRSREE